MAFVRLARVMDMLESADYTSEPLSIDGYISRLIGAKSMVVMT